VTITVATLDSNDHRTTPCPPLPPNRPTRRDVVDDAPPPLEPEPEPEWVESWRVDPFEPPATTDEPELEPWEPTDLSEILTGDDTPPTRLLTRVDGEGLIYAGKLNSLNGETELAKSIKALFGALQEMRAGRHVVWVDLEDSPRTAVARARTLGATDELIAKFFHYISPGGRLDEDTAHQLVDRFDPSLVVVDSMTELLALHGADSYHSTELAIIHRTLRAFTVNGAAVLVIDHVAKDREARGRYAIGSERKLSGLDGVALTVKLLKPFGRGMHGTSSITVAKDRLGWVRPLAVDKVVAEFHLHEDGRAELVVPDEQTANDDWQPTFYMEKVSRWLELHPDSTVTDVRSAGLGTTKYVNTARAELEAAGHLTVTRDGRANRLNITTPYRQDQTHD
jgi:hypothetical protein